MKAVHALHTDAEYQAALAEVRKLWGAPDGTPEGDRLELLILLCDAYEDEHVEVDPPDPIEAISERMDDLGMSRAQLGEMLGVGSGRVSEILNRRRALTVEMIRILAEGLGLSEHCLVQPYELERQRA
jgi:HTH-type transcriptional regulator / antitoxin HigA